MLRGFGIRFLLEVVSHRSNLVRALDGSSLPHDEQHVYARDLEVPAGGAVATARAIAQAYSAFATGGSDLGLSQETLHLLAAPAIPPTRGFYDECLKADGVQFSLGFMRSTPVWPSDTASSFGAPGSGGSLGFADPITGVGYAYITSRMGTSLTGDPRDLALRDALYSAILKCSAATRGRLTA
jgi:CubicO group peptidase (beta-lactamase class C family)